jgi:hypothetical protein
MTFDPSRRWGHRGVAGARARQRPADLHEGSPRDHLRRHGREAEAAARGDAATRKAFTSELFARTADSRNLRLAWDHLALGGGPSPGLDGLRFTDLEEQEVWGLVRTLGTATRDDTYRPGRDRILRIPKTSGKGTRTLAIPSVIDRVVQRAVVQTVQPYLDPLLDPHSLGYRPGADVNKALALAEKLTVNNGTWVLLTEDLKDAFDNVPQNRLLDVLRAYLREEKILGLIGRLVQTETGRGIRQGGPLSPLMLNVYLGHFLDRKWRKLHPARAPAPLGG